MNDGFEPGNFVHITSMHLGRMDKFQRETWTAKRCVVMRVRGNFADVRDTESKCEITVPLSALRRAP